MFFAAPAFAAPPFSDGGSGAEPEELKVQFKTRFSQEPPEVCIMDQGEDGEYGFGSADCPWGNGWFWLLSTPANEGLRNISRARRKAAPIGNFHEWRGVADQATAIARARALNLACQVDQDLQHSAYLSRSRGDRLQSDDRRVTVAWLPDGGWIYTGRMVGDDDLEGDLARISGT